MRSVMPDRVLHVVSLRQCRDSGMTDRTGGIPRSFMRDFIGLYKSLPCLWNPKARDFNYRSSKAAAYQVLVEKYREVEPGASKETVQQRLSSLRNCRRKELKKVKAAKELGEIYTPQLWYYSLMSFIDEPEDLDVDEILVQGRQDPEDLPHTFEDSTLSYGADSPAPSHDSSGPTDIERNSKTPKRGRDDDDDDEDILKFLKQRLKVMKNVASPPAQQTPSPQAASAPTSGRSESEYCIRFRRGVLVKLRQDGPLLRAHLPRFLEGRKTSAVTTSYYHSTTASPFHQFLLSFLILAPFTLKLLFI